jgi:hypothetical protein
MPTSTSMSISQFLALRVSGLQGLQVGSGQGDRISGVLDHHPYLAVVVVVGVAVGDARSSGASARRRIVLSPAPSTGASCGTRISRGCARPASPPMSSPPGTATPSA